MQQCELVLIVRRFGPVVQFLQQDDIGLLVTQNAGDFIQGKRQILRAGALVGAVATDQVVPEHIALAGQVLDVPGHHFQSLAGLQLRRAGLAAHGGGFAGGWVPGQAVDQCRQHAAQASQAEQGKAQESGQGHKQDRRQVNYAVGAYRRWPMLPMLQRPARVLQEVT